MVAVKTGLSHRKFDVVIVGVGGSDMRASLQLVKADLSVAVLPKVLPTRSHTVTAQGGIGASLGNMSEDNWHYHLYDTVKGSDWPGDQDAIEFMCRQAPNVVYEPEHFDMPLDRNAGGTIYQRPFDGHTSNYGEKPMQRACAAADRTGRALLHTLYQRNVWTKTHFSAEWVALDPIRDRGGDVLGVTALKMETGEVYILEAKTTLFTIGGAGRIYTVSTNAFINTGDGLGMVAYVGVPPGDMEFWQSHPTGVAGAGVLIMESVRGEGGILRNKDDERFMERYAPTLRGLTPRDFVSRSMDQEIKEGCGCGPNGNYVLLDLMHIGVETTMKRLPSIHETGLKFVNAGAVKEPIPAVSVIHYQIGGIPMNYHGQAVVPKNGNPNEVINGLYAVGECSRVLVYGVSRLSMNSPLDLMVFGRSAGNHTIAQNLKNREHKPLSTDAADRVLSRLARPNSPSSGKYAQDVANDIRRNMRPHVGVFRTQKLTDEGVRCILEVAERVGSIHPKDKSKVFNTARVEAPEAVNLVEMAKATMVSAAIRKESRGVHIHDGFPNRDDENQMKHSLWYSESNRLDYKPVQLKPLPVKSVPSKTRTF